MLFTALNLLPPQVIITPLYQMYLHAALPGPSATTALLYDQYFWASSSSTSRSSSASAPSC